MAPKVYITLEVDDKGIAKITQAGKEVTKLGDTVKKQGTSIDSSFGRMMKSYDTFQKGIMAFGGAIVFQQAITGAVNLAKLGAEAENVSRAFSRMSGSGNLLSDLRKATKNAISDLELMRASIVGMDLGASNEQLKTFAEYARLEGVRKGKDTLVTFNEILSGVLRGSTELLDNFGISLTDLTQKTNKMAEANGMNANKLSELERRQLSVKAATELMNERLAAAGNLELTDAEKVNRLAASWENLSVAIGRVAASPVANTFDALAQSINDAADSINTFSKLGFWEWMKSYGTSIMVKTAAITHGGAFGNVYDAKNLLLAQYGYDPVNDEPKPNRILNYPDITVFAKKEKVKTETGSAKITDPKLNREYQYSPGLGWSEIETGKMSWNMGTSGTGSGSGGMRGLKDFAPKLTESMDQVEEKFRTTFDTGEMMALATADAIGQSFINSFAGIGQESQQMWALLFNNGRSVAQQIGIAFTTEMTKAFISIAVKWAAMQIMNIAMPGSGTAAGLFMANGGDVSANKPYIVGERGPELFVPKSAGKIVPNEQINFTDNINVNGHLSDDIIKAIGTRRAMQRQELIALIQDLKAKDRFPA